MSNIKAARFLGWTSLAVGITEIAATKWLEETMGVDDHETLIRSFGVREIATGVAILAQPGLNRTLVTSLWGRVVGDALDLAVLGSAVPSSRNPNGLAAILGTVLAVTGVDAIVASLCQRDLHKARSISNRARQRVQPAIANPNGAVTTTISDGAKSKLAREDAFSSTPR